MSDDNLTDILLENGDIMAAQCAEIDRLKAQLEASEARFDDMWNHGKDLEGLLVTARNQLADARNQLVRARECLSNIDLSWLESFDKGPDGDYGGISLDDEHKAFWRDAIAFLEASGGRPAPLPRMTEAELMDALEAAYPPLPLTDEQGS